MLVKIIFIEHKDEEGVSGGGFDVSIGIRLLVIYQATVHPVDGLSHDVADAIDAFRIRQAPTNAIVIVSHPLTTSKHLAILVDVVVAWHAPLGETWSLRMCVAFLRS